MTILNSITSQWQVLTTDEQTCPECDDAVLEHGYARAPNEQTHWRGVPVLTCPECEYTRRDAPTSPV